MKRNLHWAEKVLIFAITVAFLLGMAAIFWWMWGTVVSYFWPEGPQTLINPDFWPFVGMVVILKIVVGIFHGK